MKLAGFLIVITTFSMILLFNVACERPVPKDVMFCKSGEVLVLENPFDKESAKIVMYRGDEVKLLGDTVYHTQIDSTKKDSSDFNVKVTAKRGVVGWVHIKDLQKERISNSKPRKKQSNPLPEGHNHEGHNHAKKEEKPKSDSTILKTDSLKSSEQTIITDTSKSIQNN
jgi:hypothetical protein